MVVITFPDAATEKKGLGFLVKHFSGKTSKNGEHIVPDAALAALAAKNISFIVKGKATYEHHLATIRSAASSKL